MQSRFVQVLPWMLATFLASPGLSGCSPGALSGGSSATETGSGRGDRSAGDSGSSNGQLQDSGASADLGGDALTASDLGGTNVRDNAIAHDSVPSATACDTCHKMPPLTGKHQLHSIRKKIKCSGCHGCVVDSSNRVTDSTLHNNKKNEVCGAFTWAASTGKCSSTKCHGTKRW